MKQIGLDVGHAGCRLNGMSAEDTDKASTGMGSFYTTHMPSCTSSASSPSDMLPRRRYHKR